MPSRQQLHAAVERLPDAELSAALRYLEFLSADPALQTLLTAPYDDEPETEEERRAVQEAAAGIERGEGITTEQLNRELGI